MALHAGGTLRLQSIRLALCPSAFPPGPAPLPPHFCPSQVRAELAATREELRQARLAIQERDYAIATQQRCEAALAGHAGEPRAGRHRERVLGGREDVCGTAAQAQAQPSVISNLGRQAR